MAGNPYLANRKALFDDDDVDDDTFLKNSRPRPNHHQPNPYMDDQHVNAISAAEQQRQALQMKREQIEQRTLMSTHRSLGLLEDTERVGIATAEELARQREQLEQTSERLDNINATLRFSQKHLNGLKSVFGGLKNYLSSSGSGNPPKNLSSSPSGSKLSDSSSQPTTIRTATGSSDPYENHPVNRLRQDPPQPVAGPSQQFQQRLDENLEGMVGSLSRLKNLALDLNTEIDSQNDLLDQITNKVEDADLTVAKQNNQMNKLLGKK